MSATVPEIAAGFGGHDAHGGRFLPDSGAADASAERGTGLSAREWAVVALMLATLLPAAMAGFCARGWVEGSEAQTCGLADVAVLP